MRLPALLATLTLFALAFAGCAGDKDDGDSTSTTSSSSGRTTLSMGGSTSRSSSSSGTTSSSSTGTGSPAANQPPTGSVSALVNGTSVAFTLNGTDPDGDALDWTLAFGDDGQANGTILPASVNHTYEVGNYTANFTLSDGKASQSYQVDLGFASTSGSVGQYAVTEWTTATYGCVAPFPEFTPDAPTAGVFYGEIAIEATTIGLAFTLHFDAAGLPPLGAGVGYTFYDSGGGQLGDAELEGNSQIGAYDFTGTVPTGAAYIVLWDCFAEGGTIGTYASGSLIP